VKGLELKTSFTRFLESLNTSIGSVSELVSYSFLIPIIGDIEKIITKNTDILLVSETIAERMISSGLVLVSAAVLVDVIEKIMRRLS
jgi:predicted membrane protein